MHQTQVSILHPWFQNLLDAGSQHLQQRGNLPTKFVSVQDQTLSKRGLREALPRSEMVSKRSLSGVEMVIILAYCPPTNHQQLYRACVPNPLANVNMTVSGVAMSAACCRLSLNLKYLSYPLVCPRLSLYCPTSPHHPLPPQVLCSHHITVGVLPVRLLFSILYHLHTCQSLLMSLCLFHLCHPCCHQQRLLSL